MQFTAIFNSVKTENFQLNNFDIFNVYVQNIDCGYTLEPPRMSKQRTNDSFVSAYQILKVVGYVNSALF